MSMTKKDVIKLNAIFGQIKGLGNTKFKYNIIRNIDIARPQIDAISKVEEDINKVIEGFQKDRNDLIIKLGKDDGTGRVSIDPSDKENIEKFNEGIKELVDKHKESLDEYDLKIKEFQTLLDEEIEELTFRKLPLSIFPDEGINSEQLELLENFGIISE